MRAPRHREDRYVCVCMYACMYEPAMRATCSSAVSAAGKLSTQNFDNSRWNSCMNVCMCVCIYIYSLVSMKTVSIETVFFLVVCMYICMYACRPTACESRSSAAVTWSDLRNGEKSPERKRTGYLSQGKGVVDRRCDSLTCEGPHDSDGGQAVVVHVYVVAAAAVSRVRGVAVPVQHRSLHAIQTYIHTYIVWRCTRKQYQPASLLSGRTRSPISKFLESQRRAQPATHTGQVRSYQVTGDQ